MREFIGGEGKGKFNTEKINYNSVLNLRVLRVSEVKQPSVK